MQSALLYVTTVLTGGFVWFATKFQLGMLSPEVSLIYRFAVVALKAAPTVGATRPLARADMNAVIFGLV